MKKILSILLVSVMSIALCFAMTSCDGEGHTHVFSDGWASDETHHWSPCASCEFKMENYAPHEWDDGTAQDGGTLYTCSVCAATSLTPAPTAAPDMGEEKWDLAVDASVFKNYTLRQSGKFTYVGLGETSADYTIRITADKFAVQGTIDGTDIGGTLVYGGELAVEQQKSYEVVFRALLADYENFKYDAENDVYVNDGTVTALVSLESEGISAGITMTNGKVTFENGMLKSFECDYTQVSNIPGQGEITVTADINWEFSNYGTTVIDEEPNVEEG